MSSAPVRFTTWLVPGIELSVFELAAGVVENALGRNVELSVVSSCSGPQNDDNPLVDGRADLGWMCATAYVGLDGVELVGVAWNPDDPDAVTRPWYFSDLVTAPALELDGLRGLQGRRVACNDPVSLSGHLGLRWALEDEGMSLDGDVDVVFTGGHLQSLEQFDEGQVDVAVIDSVTLRVHRPDLAPTIRLGPWPTQPLVAGSGLTAAERHTVRDALVAVGGDDRVLRAAGLAAFVPVEESDYRVVRARVTAGGLRGRP